jgi:hypothetical protein
MRCIVAVWRAQRIADGAVTAGLLLRHGGALALARLLPRRRGGIPATLSELSPEWLSGALASRSPGVRVKSFAFLERHSGTTSRARIALHYADRGSAPSMPDTLFVKITPAPPAQRLFVAVTGIGRNEVRFYRDVRPDLPVRAPEVFAAQCGAGGRLFAILLEDLAAAGARFSSVGDRASLDDARGVVVELAALHAAFWESTRFGDDLAWLPCYESRQRDMPWERFVTGQMLGVAVRRFEGELPQELSKLGDLCIRRRDGLESLWARGARTLVHGDCHLGNLYFTARGVGFLDWQICARAPGVRDVSYFLCNSLPSQLRVEHERDLAPALRRLHLAGRRLHGGGRCGPAGPGDREGGLAAHDPGRDGARQHRPDRERAVLTESPETTRQGASSTARSSQATEPPVSAP